MLLDIQYEVQQAFAELYESQQALKLYIEKLIPIAEQNVSAARSNYDVGKSSFLDLATAQRQLIGVREKYQEALAEYHQRIAAMERTIGGPLPRSIPIEQVPTPLPQ
jgi:outer membrane protein TolC